MSRLIIFNALVYSSSVSSLVWDILDSRKSVFNCDSTLYILNRRVLIHRYSVLSLTNLSSESFTLEMSKENFNSLNLGNIPWSNIWSRGNLLFGSLTNISLINDIDSGETCLNSSCSKDSLPTCTFLMISLLASPPNGGYPQSMTYYSIPRLHMSYCLLYVFCVNNSGAM